MSRLAADKLVMRGSDRAEFGCIVSFEHLPSGDWRTVHLVGSRREALREYLDANPDVQGPEWVLRSVSTPESIYRTFQGIPMATSNGKTVAAGGLANERALCGFLNRDDLMADASADRVQERNGRRRRAAAKSKGAA